MDVSVPGVIYLRAVGGCAARAPRWAGLAPGQILAERLTGQLLVTNDELGTQIPISLFFLDFLVVFVLLCLRLVVSTEAQQHTSWSEGLFLLSRLFIYS